MFESSAPTATTIQASVVQHTRHDTAALLATLRDMRIEPSLISLSPGYCAGGIPMRVSVSETLQSAAAIDRLLRMLGGALAARIPVTLSVTGLAGEPDRAATFERFCRIVARLLRDNAIDSTLIGLCLHSHQLPLSVFAEQSRSILGAGPRYLMIDGLEMRWQRSETVRDAADELWQSLWRLQATESAVLPAYGGIVSSRCPLLADEVAHSILPTGAVQVPGESAWLPIRLCLTDFSDGSGEIDWRRLSGSLQAAVKVGGRLLDRLSWPCRAQARDAVSNRRLAILLSGLGDLVVERNTEPTDLACLRWLQIVVARIRQELWDASCESARHNELLPTVADTDPSPLWSDSSHRRDWYLRWWHTIHRHAVHNRNLLVISPYAVLPRSMPASPDCMDLLPVINHADAFGFAEPPPIDHWNTNEFKQFHRRAWAIMQQCHERSAIHKDASFVAAGV